MASKWDQKFGVSRLMDLAATPPPAGPGGPVMAPGVSMEFWLKALHSHAGQIIDPDKTSEITRDRKLILFESEKSNYCSSWI